MSEKYEIQEFIEQADENGYVPLKAFCNKVFRLNENAIVSSFFEPVNPDLCIKNEVKDIQENIRNNIEVVEITKKRRGTSETYQVKTIQGGIYKDDLQLFIEKAKRAIAINSGKLAESYKEHLKQNYIETEIKEGKENIEDLCNQDNQSKKTTFWRKLFGSLSPFSSEEIHKNKGIYFPPSTKIFLKELQENSENFATNEFEYYAEWEAFGTANFLEFDGNSAIFSNWDFNNKVLESLAENGVLELVKIYSKEELSEFEILRCRYRIIKEKLSC